MTLIHALATRALHAFEPEDAHGLAIRALEMGLGPRAGRDDPVLATEVAGLALPNPVGLAPGFDKNAQVFGPMLQAGFGFVECGTVTPQPQAGNPRPRLFRLTEDQAVINRMGFNNEGLEAFAARLKARGPGIVGANIGANKDSEDRVGDYVAGLRRLWGLASYFTINISSPNTPGLRALQTKAALEELLGRLAEARDALPREGLVPMFLKVAPDLEDGEVEAIADRRRRRGQRGRRLRQDPRRRLGCAALLGPDLPRPGACRPDQARACRLFAPGRSFDGEGSDRPRLIASLRRHPALPKRAG
jgi:dihydroorotate dehydrogenase